MSAQQLWGCTSWSAEDVFAHVDRGGALANVPGDFVAVDAPPTGSPVRIASSVVGARPYYYAVVDGTLHHGSSVFDVTQSASLPWEWDAEAVAALAVLKYIPGDRTLHPQVKRVPPNSVLRFDGSTLTVEEDDFWQRIWQEKHDPQEAVEVFRTLLSEVRDAPAFLSLSAGYDSRVLLAGALGQGQRPVVGTNGGPNTTDVIVARAIAARCGLEHRVVELRADDYLPNGVEIARITSGATMVRYWHTFMFMRDVAAKGALHYVGANGEQARTHWFDKGDVARLADAVLPGSAARPLLTRKWRAGGPAADLLASHGIGGGHAAVVKTLTETSRAPGLLNRMDHLFTRQFVHRFISNGVALYDRYLPTFSPFLDARMVRVVAGLPRTEKLGANLHRRLITATYPALLEFPLGGGSVLSPRAPRTYWRQSRDEVGYSMWEEVSQLPEAIEMVHDSPHLDALVPAATRRETATTQGPMFELLLTLHFAGEAARPAPR